MNFKSHFYHYTQMAFTVIIVLVSVVCSQVVIFTGLILDSANRNPVTNAFVYAGEGHNIILEGFPFSIHVGPPSGRTDDSGRFSIILDSLSFSKTVMQTMKVTVEQKSYRSKDSTLVFSITDSTVSDTIFLVQNDSGSIGGTVTIFSTSIPIIGASVILHSMYYESNRAFAEISHWRVGNAIDSAVTDSGGHYLFNNVITGFQYWIDVYKAGCTGAHDYGPNLEKNKLSTKDFQMFDSSTLGVVKGRVLDSVSGTPIKGAAITLSCNYKGIPPIYAEQKVSTDSGYFVFNIFPYANYTLTVESNSYFSKMEPGISITFGSDVSKNIFLTAKPTTANKSLQGTPHQVGELKVRMMSFSGGGKMIVDLPEDSHIKIVNSMGRILYDFGSLKRGNHILILESKSAFGCCFLEAEMINKCVVKHIIF